MLSQKKGRIAEEKALTYLQAQGLQLIRQNYRCRLGEIDLIMRDMNYLTFIEVRSRISNDFGGGIESITYAKRQKIIKSASYYMLTQNSHTYLTRFDVISIDGKAASITWIKDAFGMDY
jgi:putative endonuclease